MKKILILALVITVHCASLSLAVPCEPCTSWGAVKWCNSGNPNPPACCNCDKPPTIAGVVSSQRAFEYLSDCQLVSIYAQDGMLLQTVDIRSMLVPRLRPGNYFFVGEDPVSDVATLLRVVVFA
jgi:hypothetical protein